jgi:DNA-damage-inducible protein J
MGGVAMTLRVDKQIKDEATKYLSQLGLNASEATRLFLHSVVLNKGLPFDLKVPNKETLKAIKDVESGKNIEKFNTSEDMFRSLGI